MGVDLAADGLNVSSVVVVVDGIGLRLADNMAVEHVASRHEAERLKFPRGELHEVGIRARPESIPLKTEVFQSVAG